MRIFIKTAIFFISILVTDFGAHATESGQWKGPWKRSSINRFNKAILYEKFFLVNDRAAAGNDFKIFMKTGEIIKAAFKT